MDTGKLNAGGTPAVDQHTIQGGVEILLVTSCYRNWDKLRPDGPLDSYADLTALQCKNFSHFIILVIYLTLFISILGPDSFYIVT